jgi:pectate lyase
MVGRVLGRGLVAAGLAVALVMAPGARPTSSQTLAEGFGVTAGGDGRPVVEVTTLDDSGPGSLRAALAGGGDRTIVFAVGGTIDLASYLWVTGANVTIDGLSAPPPGITLRHKGLVIRGTLGAHDVVVRGLRIRDAGADTDEDGIQIAHGAHHVVVQQVSVDGSGDGNVDITEGAHDVTVAWSILSGNHQNMLVKYHASRVTLHHNVFVGSDSRNPQVRVDDQGGAATDTTVDMRNNVVADFGQYGTLVWHGPWVNVVGNYYSRALDALALHKTALAFGTANVSANGKQLRRGRQRVPFAAPPLATTDPCTAAAAALAAAGARPLDDRDQASLAGISVTDKALRTCGRLR